MTVTANTTRNDYLAGNNQNVYNYTFQLNDAADVTVILNGVIQTLNVHYTVQNVGVGTGGTITFTLVDSNNDPIFPTQGQQINILMTMELDRDTSYQPNGAFLASDVNNDYDRLWLAENQQQTAINRSLRLQDKDATSGSMELPLKASRLNRMLAFDSVTGEPIAGPDVTSVTEGLTLSATLINGNNTNGNDIVFNDNDKAKFGTGSDLEIYHDGNNSIIKESGTGAFYILNSSNERMLTTTNSGAIELYHSDDIKLSTTANGVDVTGAITVSGNVDGRNISADGIKLDGIEALADVTDTDNVTTAGALMDSEITNLAQVKAFDSSDYATAAQGTTADSALPKSGGVMTGAITTNSTFDGRDVATDGTKLDGIEASADVTDATNVTAAGALMDSEVTNLAQVKAFSSSDYATAAQGTTADNALPKSGGTLTGDLNLGASDKVVFNTNFEIYRDASNAIISETGAGSLILRGTNLSLQSDDNDQYLQAIENGGVTLYHQTGGASSPKVSTTNLGIDVTGTVKFDGLEGTNSVNVTQVLDEDSMSSNSATSLSTQQSIKSYVDTAIAGVPQGDITGVTAGTNLSGGGTSGAVTLDLDNNISLQNITLTGYLRGPSNFTIDPAAHGDDTGTLVVAGNLQVDGTTTTINSTTVEIADLNFKVAKDATSNAEANTGGFMVGGSNAELKYLSSGDKWTMNKTLSFADSLKTTYGNNDDLQIYHDGSHSYISDQGTGQLRILASQFQIMNAAGTESMVFGAQNNTATLYYDNAAKLETTSTGIDVTGSVTADSLTVDTSAGQLDVEALGGSSVKVKSDGSLKIEATGGSVSLINGSTEVLSTTSSGIDVSGTVTANSGGGNASLGSHLDLGDNQKAKFGASDDLEIYHDGSNSIIKDSGTGILRYTSSNASTAGVVFEIENTDSTNLSGSFIHFKDSLGITPAKIGAYANELYIMRGSNNDRILTTNSGAAELYYSDDEKLATTSTGIDVTGTATMDGLTVGSASGVFPSEVLQIRGNGGTSGYINGFGLGASNSQLRVFADDTNNTLGSIKFDIRNRDRILIEDNGDISFYEDTGTTAKLFWDASAESLGIGTASPANTAHVKTDTDGDGITIQRNSTTAGTYGQLSFSASTNDAGTPNLWIRGYRGSSFTDNYMTFGTGSTTGSERMRITSAGNVILAAGTGTLQTATAGTSNFRAGVNAGNSIVSGGNYNVVVGDEAGTAITTGDNNVAVGTNALDANTTASNNTAVGRNALGANTTGQKNIGIGSSSLSSNTTASHNVAIGYDALESTLTGTQNTAIGSQALRDNTANNNVAVGMNSLLLNTTGTSNTAVGTTSLDANTTGDSNSAIGYNALTANTTGGANTAVGKDALKSNATASNNTAVGYQSQESNTTGSNNSSLGLHALRVNTTGIRNTAVGGSSLDANTTGSELTAVGWNALGKNTSAAYNTAVGCRALNDNTSGTNNTAVGQNALLSNTTGTHNTSIGSLSGDVVSTGTNNCFIGYNARASGGGTNNANVIGYNVIGETGYTTLGASGADIRAANGNVTWATVSDERYKKDIVDSTAGLSFINALQPRTFKYKTLGELPETFSAYEADSTEVFKNANTNHGFIAQEVKAAIDADSSIADGFKLWDDREDGSQEVAETALIPILVKAIQELTARIETLEG